MRYEDIAKSYNELYGEEQKQKVELVLKNFKINNDLKVLDVGCGTGLSAINKNTIGVDSAFKLLKQAKIPVVRGVAEQLPFKNNSFDVITSFTAIHNFKDYKKAVKEIKRVGVDVFIITVLKKAKKCSDIFAELKKNFKIKKKLKEAKDLILILQHN